ncbi:MAG TPA: glycoside hydrolase family 3 C-terminal domain-containing protein [Rhizomicrobium sp.]
MARRTPLSLGRLAACIVIAVLPGPAVIAAPLPASNPALPAQPWMNSALDPDTRANLVDAQMTQDEELQLVQGYFGVKGKSVFSKSAPPEYQPLLRGTAGFIPGVARLGIPALIESDAGVGIANSANTRPGDEATALPSGILMAATWNPDLAFSAGSAIGNEARDRAFNVVLAGAMNLARDPRGGRTFEYAGEDPLLAGTVVGAQIAGVQSAHVISTVKHFAVNDQETGRFVLSANIGEAAARESDLLAFEIAIERGEPGAVMCAYNRYNGTYACENPFLLSEVLKRDWNYPGWVLSDWGGVHSTIEAANAGLDQESASGFDHEEYFGAPLRDAVANGTLDPARLHDMVHRILRSMFAKGLMDFPAVQRASDIVGHIAIAQQEAEDGIVLLKNAGLALPLGPQLRNIAVIGGHADIGVLSGGGSSQVMPIWHKRANEFPIGGAITILPGGARVMPVSGYVFDPPSPLSAILAEAPQAHIEYATGDDIAQAVSAAKEADVAIVFAAQWMTEGSDVANLSLPGRQDALIDAVASANPHTIVVLETGGPVLMPWLDKVSGVVEAWYAGNAGAQAIARVLFGEVNPSGRLPITFPASEDQLPRPVLPGRDAHGMPFEVDYIEGANVGYRWFEEKKLTPLFAFGYGLSYTSFHIGGVAVQGGATIAVSADVTNDGPVEGKETVQAYVAPPQADQVPRLIGWSKIDLKPGETRRISIAGDPRLVARYDEAGHRWHIDKGDYTVRVGTSSTELGDGVPVQLDERDISP